MISVAQLTKRFPHAGRDVLAVDCVSFTVSPGEVYGLLGENGAGKTTTLRMILGLLAPTSGYAEVSGYRSTQSPEAVRSQIGAAIDAVVHVTRSAAGGRRVEAIGELAVAGDVLEVRPLFERRDGDLVPAGAPTRAPRRTGTPSPDERWFAC